MQRKFLVPALTFLTATAALAAEPSDLSVSDCWIRSTPGGGAAYFTLHNGGDHAAALVSVNLDAYGMAMLHQTRMVNGMMHMTEADTVPVPAHGDVAFAPGSYHVMLMDAKKTAIIGSSTVLTLTFKGGATLKSSCTIKGPDALASN